MFDIKQSHDLNLLLKTELVNTLEEHCANLSGCQRSLQNTFN